jgi:hypothetical protein
MYLVKFIMAGRRDSQVMLFDCKRQWVQFHMHDTPAFPLKDPGKTLFKAVCSLRT